MEAQEQNPTSTSDLQNLPQPVTPTPTVAPVKVGVEDSSGAVIVRPEDVYGKVLPKDESLEPKPFVGVSEPEIKPASPQAIPNPVPNFPPIIQPATEETEQKSQTTPPTSNFFSGPLVENTPAYSEPKEEIKPTKSIVGYGGSDGKRYVEKNSGYIFLKFVTIFGLILLVILSLLALDLYFEYYRGIPLIQKYFGIDLFEIILGS